MYITMASRTILVFLSIFLGSGTFSNAFIRLTQITKGILRCGKVISDSALSAATTEAAVGSEVWWKEGLKFGCTACGRCCQNEGEVWLDADEFADLSTNLKESPEAVLQKYSEKTMSGWVKLKNQISDDPKINDRCIFLGADGKQCSIYDSRPIQCRTYPFWPRLLSSESEWDKEAVQPDAVPLVEGSADRHWTPAIGGCEGEENQIFDGCTTSKFLAMIAFLTARNPFHYQYLSRQKPMTIIMMKSPMH
jgi:uncharacterized protein